MNACDLTFLLDEAQFELLLQEYVEGNAQLRTSKTRREYQFSIRNFHRWWIKRGELNLDPETLLAWMLQGLRRAKVDTVATKVIALKQFMCFLVDRELLSANPLGELRKGYRSHGYRGIVRDLKRTGSIAAVMALADHPFSGPLGPSFLAYMDFLTALGKQCNIHRYYLASFERFLRRSDMRFLDKVERSHIEQWLHEYNPASAYQKRSRLLVLEDFFRFLVDREEVACSPVPPPGPHCRRSLPPRIFTRKEIQTILGEAEKLPDHRLMPFRGRSYRMLFLSLYTLGLRSSEALNLRLGDLDFTQHCLTIGQTKFYKGRVLPFGPRYETALRSYIKEHPLLRKGRRDAFLFPTDCPRTSHLVRESAHQTLRRIVSQLGITTPAETRPPSLHSFRHTFAVHRMEQWLREGVDVYAKLPLLSVFLGHVDVAATQVYLTMTPERLGLIGERFENEVGRGIAP